MELDRLIDLAEQVGGEAWPYLVQHQKIEAAVQVWGCAAGSLTLFVFFVVLLFLYDRQKDRDGEPTLSFGILFCLIIGVVLAVVSLGGLPQMLAPEGAALYKLVK
jgi:hypothetical protein